MELTLCGNRPTRGISMVEFPYCFKPTFNRCHDRTPDDATSLRQCVGVSSIPQAESFDLLMFA